MREFRWGGSESALIGDALLVVDRSYSTRRRAFDASGGSTLWSTGAIRSARGDHEDPLAVSADGMSVIDPVSRTAGTRSTPRRIEHRALAPMVGESRESALACPRWPLVMVGFFRVAGRLPAGRQGLPGDRRLPAARFRAAQGGIRRRRREGVVTVHYVRRFACGGSAACSYCETDVRSGKHRGVIEPVANHDGWARLHRAHDAYLVAGRRSACISPMPRASAIGAAFIEVGIVAPAIGSVAHSLAWDLAPPVPGTFTFITAPALAGTAAIDEVLTVTVGDDSPAPTTTEIQWLADGKPIAGATGTTLTLTAALLGMTASARVTVTAPDHETLARTTAALPHSEQEAQRHRGSQGVRNCEGR